MPNYPFSLDDDASLFIAVNNKRTSLTSNITISDLTIPVVSTSGFPNTGFITILSDPNDILKSEAIRYEGLTLTTFSGVERGAGGTTAFAHVANDNVDLTIVADHHNELKDAVIALEGMVGISGGENFPRFDYTGSIVVPGTIYGDTLVISSTASVGTNLTVSGILSADSITTNDIDARYITASGIVASSGTFTDVLTVSGIPVAIGLDLPSLNDLYVNESGDSMSGNLDMQGNNVYNAGVVAMQDSAPAVVTSGLLWYDTDAAAADTGLPGGFLGALVWTSSGTSVPDSTWTNLAFENVSYDKGDWVDPQDPGILVVPSGVTHVKLFSSSRFASDTNGSRQVEILRNDVTSSGIGPEDGSFAISIVESAESIVDDVIQTESAVITVSGGDYFRVRVSQDSTSTINISPENTYFGIQAVDTRGIPGVNSLNLLQGDVTIVPGSGVSILSNSQTNSIELTFSGVAGGGTNVTTASGVIANKLDTTHSPVGLWLFDGNLEDSSGNGNNVDLSKTYGVAFLNNGISAVPVDNLSEYVGPTDDPTLTITGAITLQALATFSAFSASPTNVFRLIRYNGSGETEDVNNLYNFHINGNGTLGYRAEEGAGTGISYDSSGNSRVHPGITYHFALVRENDDVTFYVNGVQFGDPSSGLNAPTGGTASNINMGGSNSADFLGAVSSCKIIDSALTSDQIYEEYRRTWANLL